MSRSRTNQGMTLIEILLVLAILGIISTIAIPSFLGQRRRARLVGDAKTNVEIMRIMLEQRRADNGLYGTPKATYSWTNGVATSTGFLPGFTPKGNSRMNFTVLIGDTGLTYTITVKDATIGGTPVAMTADQNDLVKISSNYML